MRDLFDRRLTDPAADEVAHALCDGAAAVNVVADALGALVQQIECERSGREFVLGTGALPSQPPIEIGRLEFAWWTNPAGRKLVRVRGWRERDRRVVPFTSDAHAFAEIERDLSNRPHVWHVEPERVVETFTAGDPEWVVVCGCGAAGSAETLCWHHGMCGPCADRISEYGPDAVSHAPGLLAEAGFAPRDVVFTADGKSVLAAGIDGYRMWDAATGTQTRRIDGLPLDSEVRAEPSPDGRFVFFVTLDGSGNTLDRSLRADLDFFDDRVRVAQWTGRASELLVQSVTGELRLANADDWHVRASVPSPELGAKLYAVWPDAKAPRAVFARDHFAKVVRVRTDGTFIEESRFLLGHGRLDRTGMWEGGPKIVRFTPDGERLLFVRGTEMELRLPSRPKALQQVEFPHPVVDVAFAPDYERVYVLTANGVIHVCNPGMLTSVRARLRWHVEPATRLAVAPDGRTLATAGPEGVKLWPVASLLPLLD